MLVLTVVLIALSAALLGAAAFAPEDRAEPTPAPRPPAREVAPGPLVTKIRTHSPVGRFEAARCSVRSHTLETPATWFHPTDNFYLPGPDAPSRADLDHLATEDGAVVVRYRPDLPPGPRRALQRWASKGIGVVVAPGGSLPLDAYTSNRRLRCDGVDLDRLTTFTDRHFSKPIEHTPHGDSSG
jgi:hypothetical protein